MLSEWNIPEDILKNQKPIDEQIQPAEQEAVIIDEKRKLVQERIELLKGQNSQLPLNRFHLIGYLTQM